MLNVFDSYSRESQDLLHSMKESGFDHPTVVLEPNGFLPDGVESPFIYFLGQPKGEKRGRYFNEVPVPDFWEVSGDNSSGKSPTMVRKRLGLLTMLLPINASLSAWSGWMTRGKWS